MTMKARAADLLNVPAWDDIRVFLAVVRAGSQNAAAQELGVNHTTVGRRLQALEGRLGARLFDRFEGRMVPTPEGWHAVAEAQRMEEAASAFVRRLRGSNQQLSGEIRLSTTEGLARRWLLPRMTQFQAAHPALKISWLTTNSKFHDLGREADIGVWWWRPTEPQLVARKLGDVACSLYTVARYVERFGMPETFADLDQHAYLHHTIYDHVPGFDAWRGLMLRRPPAMTLEYASATQMAMASGSYITLLPDFSAIALPELIRVPVEFSVRLEAWLVYHEERRSIRRVRAVADEIFRLAQEGRGAWFE
jgi:DNA-binding transcriptional LysR family regulator